MNILKNNYNVVIDSKIKLGGITKLAQITAKIKKKIHDIIFTNYSLIKRIQIHNNTKNSVHFILGIFFANYEHSTLIGIFCFSISQPGGRIHQK